MLIDIPYGDGTLQSELPDSTRVIPLAAKSTPPAVKDLRGTVQAALAKPLGCPPVGEMVHSRSKVTIAFDDPTLPSFGPVRRVVIEELLVQLEAAGVDRANVTLICANALHRKFRPHELATIIGDELVREFGPRLVCHDAEDPDKLVYIGATPGGYDMEINRHVVDSDLTIYVNAAHNRGFSGGWKSVCVGLSTYRSIRHHHTPDGMSMSINKNRMHEMLNEMGVLLEREIRGQIFKVDTVLANPMEVAHLFAGTVWEARKATLEVLRELFPARRDLAAERFDAIVYGVPNWSPYAIFSFMNPLLTLVSSGLGYLGGAVQALGKPGCSVVMVTPCPDQWDRVHHASYPDVWENVISQSRDAYEIQSKYSERYASDESYVKKYRDEYAFHPVHAILATYPLKRLEHVGEVYVAGAQDPRVVQHVGFHPTETVQEALSQIQARQGKDLSVAYLDQPREPRLPK